MVDLEVSRLCEKLLVQFGTLYIQISVDIYTPRHPLGTIFCLHDFAGNASDFEQFAGFMAACQFRVICPDMPGRGQSAFLVDPRSYSARSYTAVLMAVMEKYRDRRVSLLGKGWGGLMSLILVNAVRFNLSELILCDVPLRWGASDPSVGAAALLAARRFDTRAEAEDYLLMSEEFREIVPSAGRQIVANRFRIVDGSYRAHFDPMLVHQIARLGERQLDVPRMFDALTARLLILSGKTYSEPTRVEVERLVAGAPNRAYVDDLAFSGLIHLTTTHQLLLILGFMKARFIPGQGSLAGTREGGASSSNGP
jgi:pimeloyl-ACP methyl ester carboxylesterase